MELRGLYAKSSTPKPLAGLSYEHGEFVAPFGDQMLTGEQRPWRQLNHRGGWKWGVSRFEGYIYQCFGMTFP